MFKRFHLREALGLIVSALDIRLNGPGSSAVNTPDENTGGHLRWNSIPSRGVAILLVTACYGNYLLVEGQPLWNHMTLTKGIPDSCLEGQE